jgi:tRNA threonylcarbamoyladenosine biosynthesis protein TsaB
MKSGLSKRKIDREKNENDMKDKILAIETSTPVCSVALQTADGRVTERRVEGRGVHSDRTFLFIKELLDRSSLEVEQLDAVLFSNGPGSYTGLRIGAAAIKGLLFRKEIDLYLFPTLLAFASGVFKMQSGNRVHAVIDARREHLYHRMIDVAGNNYGKAKVREIRELNEMIKPGDTVVGTGWERLNFKNAENVSKIGTEGISATNLIASYQDESLHKYFIKGDVETFEPEYLTMSQINNSAIRG